MKKLLKILTVLLVMFGFSSTVMADTHKSTCWNMKANDHTCYYNELQRVYSIIKGVTLGEKNNKLYSIKYEEGEDIAACYVEYADKEKTNFTGYFFNILPKFTKQNSYAGYANYSESEVNAYYNNSNDFYVIEDWPPSLIHDEFYAVVRFESSWKNKSGDKTCPKYAAFYPYYISRTGTANSIKGGEIQFSNIYDGVVDLDYDAETTKKSLLCISKDKVIEKKINLYLEKIKENVVQTFNNSKGGEKSNIESIKNTVLKENESDRTSIENELSEFINPKNEKEGSLYCESYIKDLKKNVYNNEILKESIEDSIYYLAVDTCVGKDSVPGKYLDNATNYGYYKLGKKNLAQTTQNPDYAKNLQNYLKGAPSITNDQVSCIAGYLNMASEIAEEEGKEFNNLIGSTQNEMTVARSWLDKGLNGPSIDPEDLTCEEMLGKNLTKILKFALEVLSIAGAIIAIVNSMISLIPALIAKDAEALKKAQSKCITMAIVLVLILLLPTLLTFMGNIFGFDLTCFNWMK